MPHTEAESRLPVPEDFQTFLQLTRGTQRYFAVAFARRTNPVQIEWKSYSTTAERSKELNKRSSASATTGYVAYTFHIRKVEDHVIQDMLRCIAAIKPLPPAFEPYNPAADPELAHLYA